jgi:hypothetical protein
MSQIVFRTALASLSLALLTTLGACNGGAGGSDASASAGVGSGGTGYASGTVTGFGSVVVDGVSIDDRSASVSVEIEPGKTADGDVSLGQRVEVETASDGVAKRIHVLPEVLGAVEAVEAGKLVVAGQGVYINTDASAGPVTVYAGGYASLADVQVGHLVEIHAIVKLDTGSGKPLLQATRIEKKASLAFVRVSSVVADLSTTAKTFKLGALTVDYSAASVVPAARQIANGQRVVVFGPSINNGTLAATLVRITEPKAQGVSAQLGGVVSNYNGAALTFEVNGVTINAKNAVIVPANRSISNGSYVRVKGSYGASGELQAAKVEIRRKGDDDLQFEVTLKGSVASYLSLASFSVRGVAVDASQARLENCGAGLVNEMYVDVQGNISNNGIVASKISCKLQEPAAAEVELRGSISSIDLLSRSFVLTTATRIVTVRWTDLTSFRNVLLSALLAGSTVKVEGYLQTSEVVIARKVGK